VELQLPVCQNIGQLIENEIDNIPVQLLNQTA
jgi:hypothetical protein